MTAFAMIAADEALRIANARIAQLQYEAANERLAGGARPRRSLGATVRSAISSMRAAFGAIDAAPVTTPRLADYPTRG